MARPPRGRTATVCELELLPGEEALLAPPWVPWADRLRSGDITRSDRLPKRETDERLEPGWESTGEEGDRIALDELDLGRARVLSHEGIQRAAQRWYDGEHGPQADGVRKARASCSSCGFLMLMAGQIRHVFGVCANELAVDDGRVVSLDHGCGAHSETDLPDQGPEWPVTPSRMDDSALEPLGTDGASIRAGLGSPPVTWTFPELRRRSRLSLRRPISAGPSGRAGALEGSAHAVPVQRQWRRRRSYRSCSSPPVVRAPRRRTRGRSGQESRSGLRSLRGRRRRGSGGGRAGRRSSRSLRSRLRMPPRTTRASPCALPAHDVRPVPGERRP